MVVRILKDRLAKLPKSALILGPRQVGKSTLCKELEPGLIINLADEAEYTRFLKDPGHLRRRVLALPRTATIMVDEVQRIPSLLNTVQSLIDDFGYKFLLTGSSARKLKRGQANLLPGRIFIEHLPPLVFWEVASHFDLERALRVGMLPEIYLQPYGEDLIESYVTGYLKEEIQAEALTKYLGAYVRFLDLAAELSGQYINYSKIASDSEINKETVRRYFDILTDTLVVERIPSYSETDKRRRARQREKFIFFDLGVRNVLLGRHKASLSAKELGGLFEQWIILQVLYFNRLFKKNWTIYTYRDEFGVEVDLLIDTGSELIVIEIKWSRTSTKAMFKNLTQFEALTNRPCKKVLVFRGEASENWEELGSAMPYSEFLMALHDGSL